MALRGLTIGLFPNHEERKFQFLESDSTKIVSAGSGRDNGFALAGRDDTCLRIIGTFGAASSILMRWWNE